MWGKFVIRTLAKATFVSRSSKEERLVDICRLIEPWYQGRRAFQAQLQAAGLDRIRDLQNFTA